MNLFLKAILFFLLCFSTSVLAEEVSSIKIDGTEESPAEKMDEQKTGPSFVFSEAEGIQPIDSSSLRPSVQQKGGDQDKDRSKGDGENQRASRSTKAPPREQKSLDRQSHPSEKGHDKDKAPLISGQQGFLAESLEKEEDFENTVYESLAPPPPPSSTEGSTEPEEESQSVDWESFKDTSWFFQSTKTKNKVGVFPDFRYSHSQGLRLGLRFFAYSSDKMGWYTGLSGSKYLVGDFYRLSFSYIGARNKPFRVETRLFYDNNYENYFEKGMDSSLKDLSKLFAHRFKASFKFIYQGLQEPFYGGMGADLFFRKERPELQQGKKKFDTELFVLLNIFGGYDSRDNWKDPHKGSFHQLSFACNPPLSSEKVFCKGEADFRFYLSLLKASDLYYSFKDSVLALRFFAGSFLFSNSPHSTLYSLGDKNDFQDWSALRGFPQNRFQGDKVYFTQSELRLPLYKKYISGVLFAGLGETAPLAEDFNGFVSNYGLGLRLAFPPADDMKLRLDYGIGLDRQKKTNRNFSVAFFQAF